MENDKKNKRSWKQFSLRTLVAGTVLTGAAMGFYLRPQMKVNDAYREATQIVAQENPEIPKDIRGVVEQHEHFEELRNMLDYSKEANEYLTSILVSNRLNLHILQKKLKEVELSNIRKFIRNEGYSIKDNEIPSLLIRKGESLGVIAVLKPAPNGGTHFGYNSEVGFSIDLEKNSLISNKELENKDGEK